MEVKKTEEIKKEPAEIPADASPSKNAQTTKAEAEQKARLLQVKKARQQ